jgi:hypothetical protein
VQGDVLTTAAHMDAWGRGVRRSIEEDVRAYFCIPEEDLRAGRFDRVQAVTDCLLSPDTSVCKTLQSS